jgi:hypothetical protein
LEAAHLVYYRFWGRNLNDILQPVPNYDGFKSLTEEQVDSLKLEYLLYKEAVLLVRKEFEDSYEPFKSYKQSSASGE